MVRKRWRQDMCWEHAITVPNFVPSTLSYGSVGAGRDAVYRCCRCYSLLKKAISQKKELMRRKGITIYPIPALKTLLETSWTALAEVATLQEARMILENTSGKNTSELSTLGDHCLANNFCLQWDNACPSCFQRKFDDPPPAIGTVFSSLQQLRGPPLFYMIARF
jgi:hypothetical protein